MFFGGESFSWVVFKVPLESDHFLFVGDVLISGTRLDSQLHLVFGSFVGELLKGVNGALIIERSGLGAFLYAFEPEFFVSPFLLPPVFGHPGEPPRPFVMAHQRNRTHVENDVTGLEFSCEFE